MTKKVKTKNTVEAYLYNVPLLLIISIFILIPVAGTFIISFFREVTFLPTKFIAFDNYIRLLGDSHFLGSTLFTLLFTTASVSIELILGLIFALVLNEALPGRTFLRITLLIPWVIPIAISGRIWELIYNYDYGLLNYLATSLGITNEPISWLGTTTGAFISIVISDVWKTTPFMSVIILAGLSTINDELYEQAKIDGAKILQRFFNLTLPLLKPVLIVALLFRTIDAVRIFDLIYVLTGGGPGGSTTSLSLYAYNYYVSGDSGYGSAVSVIVFLIAITLSAVYLKTINIKETS
jgi:trehalose/maltose transport system permease protein